MMWAYWLKLYLETFCVARGLSPNSIEAYSKSLECFQRFSIAQLNNKAPDKIAAVDVLAYVEYLRLVRNNGASAINRQVTIIKNFFRAMVSMGYLSYESNPMKLFPKIKAAPQKLPVWLSKDEVKSLSKCPRTDTVIGLRDRAIIVLLYGTGIRASECAALKEEDIDLSNKTIQVLGKGGHSRVVPLNKEVLEVLDQYRQARGKLSDKMGFFRSRNRNQMSRNAIYERVRTLGRKAGIKKRLSPHRLRHTFATHLVKEGVDLLTISKLLGHRQMSSTQIYLHLTAEDLRHAAERHPVSNLIERLDSFLPNMKLPFQYPLSARRKEVNANPN
jgi:site-specific recombinase XerD